ncbi:MAG: hypothetical protein FD129_3275 [bacterium]|nr:MAG: hypothetical protein FD129_3275 [bacterium]
MSFDPATEIQNFLVFGEYGDVNPSIRPRWPAWKGASRPR